MRISCIQLDYSIAKLKEVVWATYFWIWTAGLTDGMIICINPIYSLQKFICSIIKFIFYIKKATLFQQQKIWCDSLMLKWLTDRLASSQPWQIDWSKLDYLPVTTTAKQFTIQRDDHGAVYTTVHRAWTCALGKCYRLWCGVRVLGPKA